MDNSGLLGYMNGIFVPAEQMSLSVADRGVAHGVAITELMRTFGGELIFLEKHLKRFETSAHLCRIPLAEELSDVAARLTELVTHNVSLQPADQELGLILSATPGINPTYTGGGPATPTLYAHTFALPAGLWADATQTGVSLAVSTVAQVPDRCIPVNAKSRSRMAWYLAEQQVRDHYPGAQALVVDEEGHVCETSTANVFVVKDGQLLTPPADAVLPGIARRITLEVAAAVGIPAIERTLRIEDCLTADEMFVTSTPYGLLPVRQFCNPAQQWTTPGEIFIRLLQGWTERVGFDLHGQLRAMAAARTV